MAIKMKFPLDDNSHTDARLQFVALFVFCISCGIMCLDIPFRNSRQSIFLLSNSEITLADYRSLCNIPYDECRCSVLSNKSNSSIKCITDNAAMTAHILPLVSYVLQLYIIYEVFSFSGNYSHIFTDIFWVVALVVFIIVAIGVHGSSCFYSNTIMVICMTGISMFGFVYSLVIFGRTEDFSCERRNNYRDQRLVKNIMMTKL
jgi:hypothetical protein